MIKLTILRPAAFTLVLLILLTGLSVSGQTVRAGASQITELDVNGLKVLIKRRPGTPTVAAGLFFRGGVSNVTAENAGIENFVLNAAAEGTKNFPRQKLRKETSSIGTVISAGSNYDYSVLALACTKLDFDRSWAMFTDVALNPTFAAEDVERVREATLTALRSQNDSPEGALEALTERIVYAGHPYANSPNGTIENITRFKAVDLAAYHKKMVETSRMLLVIVGDVEPAAVQKQIAASFGGVPKGNFVLAPVPVLSFSRGSVDITQKSLQTNYVKGTFAAPSLRDPDYYAMRAATAILQSAVFQEVRVKRNLSYAPDADMDNNAANTAAISVSSVNPNEAITVMLGELNNLRQGSTDDESLKQMAGYFLTTYFLKQETNAAQASELAQYELIGGGWRRSLEFLDRIRAVKAADVQAVANKYMRNLRFTVVGNPADINRSIFLQN